MKNLGTSSVVVAAFVGPGTVLTCASAGVDFGAALGWVLVFSVAATFILQSFTAGAGILADKDVGEAMRELTTAPGTRAILFFLVVLGLWAGTAAFETGNILGAAAGLETLTGGSIARTWIVLTIGAIAAATLALRLRMVTVMLTGLVAFMSIVFVATMVLAPVNWGQALRGMVVWTIPEGSLINVLALVGTTVVAYNLFLHGSTAKQYWAQTDRSIAWRGELTGMAIFLPLGGVISLAIMLAGSTLTVTEGSARSVATLAPLLEPAAGPMASVLFGLGLFAAGITSAVTAPLAAAHGIREISGWPRDERHIGFRLVWISVLVTGLTFAMIGRSPLEIIIAAQAANGLLLPFMAGFVLYLSARQPNVNLPRWYLGLGVLVTLICAILGARTLLWVWGQVL
ncbi:MAG: divalent metal cation transporter [Bacteroidota bacterium]|nr:divalent metal cation transporter [Bacteroidota bacterium]